MIWTKKRQMRTTAENKGQGHQKSECRFASRTISLDNATFSLVYIPDSRSKNHKKPNIRSQYSKVRLFAYFSNTAFCMYVLLKVPISSSTVVNEKM